MAAVIGESFGAIYKRNAINAGLPLFECSDILNSGIKDGDEIAVDLTKGTISTVEGTVLARAKPLSQVGSDIYQAGGLLELGADSLAGEPGTRA